MKYVHMFLYAVCCLFTCLFIFALTSCCDSNPSQPATPKPNIRDGEHYFKDIQKVNAGDKGFYTYRTENDEVICYTTEHGLWCKWKQQPDLK